jgi:hypothetical protein
MKIYLPNVKRFSGAFDGWNLFDIEFYAKPGEAGFDKDGFWIDVNPGDGIDPCTGVNTRVLAEKARQWREQQNEDQ